MQSSMAVAGMDALSDPCENILTRRANQWHCSIIAQFARRPWPCPTTGSSSAIAGKKSLPTIQQKTIHLAFLPWAAVARHRATSLLPGCGGRRRPALKAARLRSFGAELEGVRQRKQQPGAAARVVGCAVAKRHGHTDVSPQVAAQKEPHAAAGRRERQTVGVAVAVVPGRAGVDEAVELITGQVLKAQLLIETQFERTGDAVVAADLGAAIATSESRAAQVELLRREKRAGRDLASP